MNKRNRTYKSTVRAAAAAATRARIVEAASNLLRSKETPIAVTMDAVAKAAGVTRLTVYNQFGDRNALFEEVFDAAAAQGGLTRIPEVMSMSDSEQALRRLIEVFCNFWASDSGLGRLHDLGAIDPEFAAALSRRNERRRKAITTLVARMSVEGSVRDELVDVLFALTSEQFFRSLTSKGRSARATCRLISGLCSAAISSLE